MILFRFFPLFLTIFLLGVFFVPQVRAGDGSVNGCQLRRDFSGPNCGNPGYTVNPMGGGGSKQFIFNAAPGSSGQCQVQCGGNGRITSGSGSPSGSVAAGGTWTYNFSTGSDGGSNTNFEITATIDIVAAIPSPTPTSTPTPSPIPSPTQPPPEIGLALTNNICTSGSGTTLSFSFSTNNPSAVAWYHIDKNGLYLGSSPGSNPNITIQSGQNETATYTARVQTVQGTFGGSNSVQVTGASCPFRQNQPQASCGNIRLSWSPYAAASNYEIWYWRVGDASYRDSDIRTGGATTKDLNAANGLSIGNQYSFVIVALNSSGIPIAYSDGGQWSHGAYGYTTFPDCRPPGPFVQMRPVDSCVGVNCQIRLSWESSEGASPISYRVVYFDSSGGGAIFRPPLGNVNSTIADSSWGLITGHDYSFIILATNDYGAAYSDNSTWSHSRWGYTTFQNCAPPIVNLWINGQQHTQLPLTIRQNSSAGLTWEVINADTANASSNPQQSYWNGPKEVSTATPREQQSLDTSVPGTYLFTLTGINNYTGITTAASIQLNIVQYPGPYIQTTQGDIHTNEDIEISPP